MRKPVLKIKHNQLTTSVLNIKSSQKKVDRSIYF